MRKRFVLAAAALMAVMVPQTIYADWYQEPGTGMWRYQKEDTSWASSSMENINGCNYYFDNNGYMVTGWRSVGERLCYFDASGAQLFGWQMLDGKWYYLDPLRGGGRHLGWLYDNGKRYYMNSNGEMQTGVFFLDQAEAGSEFAYYAYETGELMTDQTVRNGTAQLKADGNGRIQYRNSKTERDHERYGTPLWQPLKSQEQLDEEADSTDTLIKEIKDMLYDSYKSDVKKASKSERDQALEDWKEEVRGELGSYLNSAAVEEFIQQVTGK